MLRIEESSEGRGARLLLSGRIQSDGIACIRAALSNGCACKVLDLREVTLVDIAAVRFLVQCEDEGIELAQCPPYVRQWMLLERAARARPR